MNLRSKIKAEDIRKIVPGSTHNFQDGNGATLIKSVERATCLLISTDDEQGFFYELDSGDYRFIPARYAKTMDEAFRKITDVETVISGSVAILEDSRKRFERSYERLGAIKREIMGYKSPGKTKKSRV